MAADITLPGVSSLAGPGVYVSLTIPGSQSGAPSSQYTALLLANGLSGSIANAAATATPGTLYSTNTLVPVNTVQDVINLFGSGSPMHLGYSAFRAKNPNTPVTLAPIEVISSGTAASLTITITAAGAPNQTSGLVQFLVDGKTPVQANYVGGSSPDSATTIAANLAAAINANGFLPVVATSASAVLTVTAKVKGQRGNFLRGFAQVVSGSGVSVSVTSPTFFTSGAGSDSASYAAVLSAISETSNRFYYYIPEAGYDSVDGYNSTTGSFTGGPVALVQEQIDSMALPAVGIRQRVIFGSVDTLASTQHTALDVDDVRCEGIWLPNADLTPFELAATWASAIMDFETVPLSAAGVNFDNFGGDPESQPFWSVPAPLDGSSPSNAALQSAIITGITPVKCVNQRTVVYKRCTSYFYPLSSPSLLDLRATDAGMVTVCDRFFDDLQGLLQVRFPRSVIGTDPASGSAPAPPHVVTPDNVLDVVNQVIAQYASAAIIQGPPTLAGVIVQENANPPTSIGVRIPLYVANLLHTILVDGNGLQGLVI